MKNYKNLLRIEIILLIYLSLISLSLLISCFISFFGADSLSCPKKNITTRIAKITKPTFMAVLPHEKEREDLGFNLSCIIKKLYLHSKNKTKL